ncbi:MULTISPECIES: PepSY domain-containing protein [Achromobacter]|uniref:PepSY-associated TM helix domain-containing protein n=1 Tax=Achromobacter TaxID=222 RepID=UPI001EF22CC9|nr:MULTISPECIES: PepSY-associated TM helix domain-containing protein [Achromobacter]MCG7326093.1 PepSY domain-containing protein [Achromobacter sp. ACRQX]MDH0681272.1 PepSY domain-containing protein [Achromobacter animicus]
MPRRVWLACHRWVALVLGGILILSGLTGALLVAARPLDRMLHPAYFVAESRPDGGAVPLETVRRNLVAAFGPDASLTFDPPRKAGDTLQVRVRAAWRGTVYLDPSSGREQGRRAEDEGVTAVLYQLHSALMLGQTGKAVLAWAALAYLVLMVSGLVLWWPRKWPPSLRMVFDKGTLRALFDVHRQGGAILAIFLAVAVATGAYLAWRPIGGWITAASGQARVVAPKLPGLVAGMAASQDGMPRPPSLDAFAAAAREAFPDGEIGFILYTPHLDRPMAIRMRVPDDSHPNGRSTVWLDPRDGRVLAAHRWNELDPGTRINSVIYPLHTGELGGPAGEIGVAMLGLGLATLGISGLWLWWRRRSDNRRNTSAVRHLGRDCRSRR